MQICICPQGGTVTSVSPCTIWRRPTTTLDFPAHWNFPSAPQCIPCVFLSPLALSGRSTFTTKRVRQGRWGGREGREMNRWAKLVPLAGTSLHPRAQPLLFILRKTVHCKQELWMRILILLCDMKVRNKRSYNGPAHLEQLERGTAGRIQSIGAVLVWLRRVDESRHFNSYTSSLASHLLSVNVCIWWRELQRKRKCKHSLLLPSTFYSDVSLQQIGVSVSAPFTRKCKHASAQCFYFDFKTDKQHELCDPGSERETFTAGSSVCRKPPRQHFGVQTCILISLFPLKKSCIRRGAGKAVRGKGCWGCQSLFHLSAQTPSHHVSVYLRRVFKASVQCQMCEPGMRAAVSLLCVFLHLHRAVNKSPLSMLESRGAMWMTACGNRDDSIITCFDTTTVRRSTWRGLCCCLRDKQGWRQQMQRQAQHTVGGKKSIQVQWSPWRLVSSGHSPAAPCRW